MGVLSELEPKQVFRYFEEIAEIPHGSGNVDRISDYLVDFARERKLFCVQDELKNVIIVKEAAPGYEAEPPVILQGHMDMVAVKKPGCDIDMRTEGLRLAVDGDRIYAEGTSLGGDDGIAVAYSLALLDADTIGHPRLEVIITVDEEVGMDGARGIDLSMLKGNRMVNLDSEEEGIFLTSCAGGARVKCHVPLETEQFGGLAYEVTVGGLLGGLAGGLADNAIPRETVGILVIEEKDSESFAALLDTVEKEIQAELSVRDPGVCIRARKVERAVSDCVTVRDTARAADFLWGVPNGVQAMSADMPGLVETSLNLGILKYEEGMLLAEFSVRSSVESAKHALIGKLSGVTKLVGGTVEVTGDYPGWQFRRESPLRDKMTALYEEMYGIHAGLECGILGSKIPDLDCVSIGPDMKDIHTTEETLSISSTRRVWEYLVKLLERKDRG